MITIDFTYETVSPESAENGDIESSGYITPGMWKYDVEDYARNIWQPGNLAGLISFAQSLGICTNAGCSWFYSVDPDVDYLTGEDTFYAMHVSGASDATMARIARLL